MVPPGGGDFERPFGPFLTFHIGHVPVGCNSSNFARLGGGQDFAPFEVVHGFQKGGWCDHLSGTDPGRLWPAIGRADKITIRLCRCHGRGEGTCHCD